MPKFKRARSSSPVLGDDTSFVKRSKTGRPARASAGRKSIPAGYVLVDDVVEEDAKEQQYSDSDHDESEEDDEGERGRWSRSKPTTKSKNKKQKQRQQRPLSPPLPVLDDLNDVPQMTQEELSKPAVSNSSESLEVLSTVSFAPGQLPNMIAQLEQMLATLKGTAQESTAHADEVRAAPESNSVEGKTGFLDLPSELRNRVYRYALVQDKTIEFPPDWHYPQKTSGGQLLATCQQIEKEASEILYGENSFKLSRDRRSRGKFYETKWQEVGWMDIRIFLQRIGPKNIGNIERLECDLSDTTHQAGDANESHRCVNNRHLLAVFQMLATSGRLRELKFEINTRKWISGYEREFVEHLQAIQSDKVIFFGGSGRPYWARTEKDLLKFSEDLRRQCIDKMERTVKLYT